MEASDSFDVVVVGAGAAGLLAAARSAERGRRTLLLEKNRKAGVKILMSGGTRCNLTHDCEASGIIAAFGSAGPFLHAPLAALGPRELVALFNAEGLPTKREETGKIFPQSDRAADVVAILLGRLHRSGAQLSLDEPVTAIDRDGTGFHIATERRTLSAAKLMITTGGKSYPGCGTTGEGYAWLAAWRHTIRPPRPALVPLLCEEPWVRELSGITIPDVAVTTAPRGAESPPTGETRNRRGGGKILRRGSLLFTHFGLSGPVVLDISREFTRPGAVRAIELVVDFLPGVSTSQLEEQIAQFVKTQGKRQVIGIWADALPRRLLEALFTRAEIPAEQNAAELSKPQRQRLVQVMKRTLIVISGSRGFDKAEVTAGGVALDEVDSKTMQSKVVENLYLAGEILDLDGFIGGYNFQAAFSTGWLAGSSV